MSFSSTSKNLRLEQKAILYADCLAVDGTYKPSSIRLDYLLGNVNGKFVWGEVAWHLKAALPRLEGGFLVAGLQDSEGEWWTAKVNLDERIENKNGVLTATLPLVPTCRNLRLDDDLVLHAECRTFDNTAWKDSVLPLDYLLGNIDGKFVWGQLSFEMSASKVSLDGHILHATLQDEAGKWQDASVDLSTNVVNRDGILEAVEIPAVLTVPKESTEIVLAQLQQMVEKDPTMTWSVYQEKDGPTWWYANATAEIDNGVIFKSLTAETTVSVFHLLQSKGSKIQQVSMDAFTMNASATLGTMYFGVDANLNLIKAKASVFDLTLGIGVETGFGIKEGSLSVEALGCGFSIGRKLSISVFGSSFGIDFGRFFD